MRQTSCRQQGNKKERKKVTTTKPLEGFTIIDLLACAGQLMGSAATHLLNEISHFDNKTNITNR
jgi:hypothetical protein